MVNTFMPYNDFNKVAKCLDYKRLGKQRVETWQIYQALTGQTKGWINHPATKMWKGYEKALLLYGIAICKEWIARGYNDTMLERFENAYKEHLEDVLLPNWIQDEQSLLAYKSNLIRKDSNFYKKEFGDEIPNNIPYTWGDIPTKYLTNRPDVYEILKTMAERDGLMLADHTKFSYSFDKFSGADWVASEIFDKKGEQKKDFLGNKVKVHLGGDDFEFYGTIQDFGYSHKSKRYFITVARYDFPPTQGFTGFRTFTKYYDRYSKEPIYRLKRALKNEI